MADGDVLVDTATTLPDGKRVRLFAVESSSYPGGVNYRFQYYDPETGAEFLRYDNTQMPTHGAGHHHRHSWDSGEETVAAIEFENLEAHINRFQTELQAYDTE